MKSRRARFAKYLGIFAGLFFVASIQCCQAELITMGKGLAYYKFPLLILAGLVVVLEMFLLRWLLEINLPRALTTAFLANLASAVAGPKLSDFIDFILFHLYPIFPGFGPGTLLLQFDSSILIPLLFVILLKFPIIWILNRPEGWKRVLEVSAIVNCLTSPLLIAYLMLLHEAYKSIMVIT
jgi:hypothetical protein